MLSKKTEINKKAYYEIDNYRRSVDHNRECYDLQEYIPEEFEQRTRAVKRKSVVTEQMERETRNVYLKKIYGISLNDYNVLLEKQKGLCAICRKKMDKPNIDHDHETGEVRGLLCLKCNVGLGFFKDSTTSLEAAVNYLK